VLEGCVDVSRGAATNVSECENCDDLKMTFDAQGFLSSKFYFLFSYVII